MERKKKEGRKKKRGGGWGVGRAGTVRRPLRIFKRKDIDQSLPDMTDASFPSISKEIDW